MFPYEVGALKFDIKLPTKHLPWRKEITKIDTNPKKAYLMPFA